MKNRPEYGRLKPEALTKFAKEGFPKARALFRWMRQRKPHPIRMSEHHYAWLKEGQQVPWELVVALAQYTTEVAYRPCDVAVIAEKTETPPPGETISSRNPWSWGWGRLFAFLTEPFQIADEAYCDNEADFDLAAKMGLECVGQAYAPGGPGSLTDSEALAAGERVMARSRAKYASWLLSLWQEDPRAVLFSVLASRHDNQIVHQRLGVWGSVPLKKAAYERFRQGKIEDSELTAADFESPSNYIFLHMCSESSVSGLRNKNKFGLSQINTMMYQISMLLNTLTRKGPFPSLIAIAGTPENEKRLNKYGFTNTGITTPRSRKRLYEMTSTDDITRKARRSTAFKRGQYDLMWTMLRLYQAIFAQARQAIEHDE